MENTMDLKDLSFEELKILAEEIEDFKLNGRWAEDRLREELEKYFAENPVNDADDGDDEMPPRNGPIAPEDQAPTTATPPEEPEEPAAPATGGMLKVKSKYRGVIGTSAGQVDFGEDGIVEIPEAAARELVTLEGYDLCN